MDQKTKFLARGIQAKYVGEAQSDADAVTEVLKGRI